MIPRYRIGKRSAHVSILNLFYLYRRVGVVIPTNTEKSETSRTIKYVGACHSQERK